MGENDTFRDLQKTVTNGILYESRYFCIKLLVHLFSVCTHIAKLLEVIDFTQESSKERNLRLCLCERVSSTNQQRKIYEGLQLHYNV